MAGQPGRRSRSERLDAQRQELLTSSAPPPPFPAALRVLLRRLETLGSKIIERLPEPHSATTVETHKRASRVLARLFLSMAMLSPVPSPEVRYALYRFSAKLSHAADLCRYPRLERGVGGTLQGYFGALAALTRGLAYAQGDVPATPSVPAQRMDILSECVQASVAMIEASESAALPPGEWRRVFDTVVYDLANFALKGDVFAIEEMRAAYRRQTRDFKSDVARIRGHTGHLDEIDRWELDQAVSYVEALGVILTSYSSRVGGDLDTKIQRLLREGERFLAQNPGSV